VITVNLYAR